MLRRNDEWCWFSLVVAWKQERVAGGRFGENMGH
jgi:hypothetical protein